MNRQKVLRVLNPVMFLLVLYQGITGFFRREMYSHFRVAHPIVGGLILLCVGIHLYLNWPWVKSQYGVKRKKHK